MVIVYDINARNVVTSMAFDEESIFANYLPCNLYWKSNTNLLVGRGHSVKNMVFFPTEKRVATVSENVFEGVFVCGVVPLSGKTENDWKLAVLGYEDTLQRMKRGTVPPPRVLVVSPEWCNHPSQLLNRGPTLQDTLMNIRGYQSIPLNEYHMACFAEEKKFYIVSPNDIIEVEECDANDHISWLIEREYFEEAMQYVEDPRTKGLLNPQMRNKEMEIWLLINLVKTGKLSKAARRCPQILGPEDKQTWEEIIMMFTGNMSVCC